MRKLNRALHIAATRTLLRSRTLAADVCSQDVFTTVEAALASDGPTTLEAIGSPDVLAPLLMHARGRLAAEDALRRALPPLLLLLASRGLVTTPLRIRLGDAPLVDAPAGRALVDCAGTVMTVGPEGASYDGEPRPRSTSPFFSIAGAPANLMLCTIDTNPQWHVQDHPNAGPNAIDLGGVAEAQWCARLSDALDFIRRSLPNWYEELPHSLNRILPVGVEPERHRSASFQMVPRIAYMSLHPDALVMAEAIVHETQHGKLHVLRALEPLMLNGATEWTRSPVRPDLRPLDGVLLAAHAFVPVAMMYQRIQELGLEVPERTRFELRQARVIAGNANALRILRERAQWTPVGQRIFSALCRIHAHAVANAPPLPDHEDVADLLPPG